MLPVEAGVGVGVGTAPDVGIAPGVGVFGVIAVTAGDEASLERGSVEACLLLLLVLFEVFEIFLNFLLSNNSISLVNDNNKVDILLDNSCDVLDLK
ncbi:unnamed protein product [[Candida] boidinii]|nr:unnamed protein product [[Candida] boidinii]